MTAKTERRIARWEKLSDPIAPRAIYYARLRRSVVTGLVLVSVSLLIGAAGYHFLERLPWIDAFLNAAMILGGMGPVDPLTTSAGKIFATVYALYSGLALIVTAGIIITPALHRLLHRFHVDG